MFLPRILAALALLAAPPAGAEESAPQEGGEIIFTAAPASTVRMTAYRNPPMLQEVVLIETGKIPVKAAIEILWQIAAKPARGVAHQRLGRGDAFVERYRVKKRL